MDGWMNALGSLGKNLFSGNNMANFGNLASGVGNIYGAYNANKLGNQSIDLAKQQNNLLLQDYEERKKDKATNNATFASVWG